VNSFVLNTEGGTRVLRVPSEFERVQRGEGGKRIFPLEGMMGCLDKTPSSCFLEGGR